MKLRMAASERAVVSNRHHLGCPRLKSGSPFTLKSRVREVRGNEFAQNGAFSTDLTILGAKLSFN